MEENFLNQITHETMGKLFLKFIDTNQTLIFIFSDSEGKVIHCNRSFSNLVNEEPKEVIGKNIFEYMVGCDEHYKLTLIQDLIGNKKPLKQYLHITGKKGFPRTYHFHFFYEDGFVFALGEPEVESLEHSSEVLMRLNNEMLSLHRNKR